MNFENPTAAFKKKPDNSPDQDLENNPQEARELRVLKAKMAHARKTLRGEHIFGDTVWGDLQKSLVAVEEGGIDASALRGEASEMIAQLPSAEMANMLGKAEGFLQAQDIAAARSWHAGVQTHLRSWEQKGGIPTDKLAEFESRIKRLESVLYDNGISKNVEETEQEQTTDNNVINLAAIRADRQHSLSQEKLAALEDGKSKLSEDIQRTFKELQERYTRQTAEAFRLQKKADLILGTKKAGHMEQNAKSLPWDPYEAHMLGMVDRSSSVQDLNLIKMNFAESTANIIADMDEQDKALALLRNRFG